MLCVGRRATSAVQPLAPLALRKDLPDMVGIDPLAFHARAEPGGIELAAANLAHTVEQFLRLVGVMLGQPVWNSSLTPYGRRSMVYARLRARFGSRFKQDGNLVIRKSRRIGMEARGSYAFLLPPASS